MIFSAFQHSGRLHGSVVPMSLLPLSFMQHRLSLGETREGLAEADTTPKLKAALWVVL